MGLKLFHTKDLLAAGSPVAEGWADDLAEAIADIRTDKETGEVPRVWSTPMERAGAFQIQCHGLATVVAHLYQGEGGAFVTSQPEIPAEATQFTTQPPNKTRPLRDPGDLETLAESISMFASTDFLKWQATAILESAKAAHWNGYSAHLIAAVARESWCPNVSKDEAGAITMKVGRTVAKATADGLSIKFNGRPEGFLAILRAVFRVGQAAEE